MILYLTVNNRKITVLEMMRQCLKSIEIHNYTVARLVSQSIPASCPFEREIKLFHRTIVCIPALCKLNPFYEQVIELRFKALTYLASERGANERGEKIADCGSYKSKS